MRGLGTAGDTGRLSLPLPGYETCGLEKRKEDEEELAPRVSVGKRAGPRREAAGEARGPGILPAVPGTF